MWIIHLASILTLGINGFQTPFDSKFRLLSDFKG